MLDLEFKLNLYLLVCFFAPHPSCAAAPFRRSVIAEGGNVAAAKQEECSTVPLFSSSDTMLA